MKLNEIKNSQDVYRFVDENIEYGWIDIYGKLQFFRYGQSDEAD